MMMAEAEIRPVSEATLRRLPSYLHVLQTLADRGRGVVSCSHIGEILHLDPTQVRKDLEATGIVGRPKVGYEIPALVEAIRGFLGWNNAKDAFLVGVGHLGTSLLGYQRFASCGVNIVAAFDAEPTKVGTIVHGRNVFPMEKLTDLARRMHIHIGILTVPATAAQDVADQMVAGGIQAIWNFAPAALQLPQEIIVQNENLYPGLAVLSNRLAEVLRTSH